MGIDDVDPAGKSIPFGDFEIGKHEQGKGCRVKARHDSVRESIAGSIPHI